MSLATGPSLCLPSISPHPTSHLEIAGGKGGVNPSGTSLAASPMVCGSPVSVGHSSMEDPLLQDFSLPGAHIIPGSAVGQVDHMEVERRSTTAEDLLPAVIRTIRAARRPATICIHDSTWASALGAGPPLSPGHSPILCPDLDRSLTTEPLIQKFQKGATNLHPSTVHRYPAWDLPLVLQALTQTPFEPLRDTSLLFMLQKRFCP